MESRTFKLPVILGAVALLVLANVARAQDVQPEAQMQLPASSKTATAEKASPTETDIDRILKDEQLRIGLQEAYQRKTKLRQPDIDPARMGTVFFTLWQYALLKEAKLRFQTRAPDQSELAADNNAGNPTIKGPREVALAGIAYTAPMDWTVWLNGERITPDAIPKEVIDIKVRKEYIELKWFDAFTDLIFPVRLRPHQRFNLDSRIFLPGEGVQ